MHNAFGALTSLASLQAIAAMQGAANLSGAGGIAALGGNVDFMNSINRQANLGGLGGLGINTSKHLEVSILSVWSRPVYGLMEVHLCTILSACGVCEVRVKVCCGSGIQWTTLMAHDDTPKGLTRCTMYCAVKAEVLISLLEAACKQGCQKCAMIHYNDPFAMTYLCSFCHA